MKKNNLPRGYRNCNPLNIVKNKNTLQFEGVSKEQTDPLFLQFTSMKYGFRAAYLTLRQYYYIHNLRTIEKMINRWCPDGTAETYVSVVSQRMHIDPDSDFVFSRENVIKLAVAMAFVENGYLLRGIMSDAIKGWDLF